MPSIDTKSDRVEKPHRRYDFLLLFQFHSITRRSQGKVGVILYFYSRAKRPRGEPKINSRFLLFGAFICCPLPLQIDDPYGEYSRPQDSSTAYPEGISCHYYCMTEPFGQASSRLFAVKRRQGRQPAPCRRFVSQAILLGCKAIALSPSMHHPSVKRRALLDQHFLAVIKN